MKIYASFWKRRMGSGAGSFHFRPGAPPLRQSTKMGKDSTKTGELAKRRSGELAKWRSGEVAKWGINARKLTPDPTGASFPGSACCLRLYNHFSRGFARLEEINRVAEFFERKDAVDNGFPQIKPV